LLTSLSLCGKFNVLATIENFSLDSIENQSLGGTIKIFPDLALINNFFSFLKISTK